MLNSETHVACWLTAHDLHLFNEGTHQRLYEKLGAHVIEMDGLQGTRFAVWAPNAAQVAVTGDFNNWAKDTHRLQPLGNSGIWHGFLRDIGPGTRYKYFVHSQHDDYCVDKTDPFCFSAEVSPQTASIVCNLDYEWMDTEWMERRQTANRLDAPISIYELHLGSWARFSSDEMRLPNYRELAQPLAEYVTRLGFTHVELMPIMEHPFYGSWGYQSTGYFAATSRYGSPQDLMFLIDHLHQHGIGVILDWVPSHFTSDEHGLTFFDGTHLYEHADRRKGWHPDWHTCLFNYGRHEVRAFLLSSAMFWLDKYHADGLRVDAVASMLYLDYSRQPGEWIPNEYGGNENLEAVSFLRQLNRAVYQSYPDTITIAEESTAWPMVSRPVYVGGLGFGAKWDMGWMHDTLGYFAKDPIHRKHQHGALTFRSNYAFSENYVLPLSHDEVVHGKGSLLDKMPGDRWQKFANLRLLLGYMWMQPGKKLLFMGGEFGQWGDWNHDRQLDWSLITQPDHQGLLQWVQDLNALYRSEPSLHRRDCDPRGFEWVDAQDSQQSILSFLRHSDQNSPPELAVFNFTPAPRFDYRIGVDTGGLWKELLNSDAPVYGGSGMGNFGGVQAEPCTWHGRHFSLALTLPPLALSVFRPDAY